MSENRKGLGCLLLFALPFAGIGAYMGYRTASVLWEWQKTRAWSEVPAEILSVELATHRGSDSTTYEVRAEYRYSFSGIDYRGARVSLHPGADNVGDYHQVVYEELLASFRAGRSVPGFVNPESPGEAILLREPRWGLLGVYGILVVVFGGVGFGLVGAALFGSQKLAREEEMKALHPDEPWRHREEWRTGRIRSSSRPAFVSSALFAGLWNAVSAPLLFLVPRELERGSVAALIGILFSPSWGSGSSCGPEGTSSGSGNSVSRCWRWSPLPRRSAGASAAWCERRRASRPPRASTCG